MSPSVSSEETTIQAPGSLTSSKKWLLQVALLFGMLGLTRWSHPAPARPLAARTSVPKLRDLAPTTARTQPLPRPESKSVVAAVAFTWPGQ